MQDRRPRCQVGILTVALLLGCKHAPTASAPSEVAEDPTCHAAREAVRRAPGLDTLGPRTAEARSRREPADISRLAAVACPFTWVASLHGADRSLSLSIGPRCDDADAMLAFTCSLQGPLSEAERDVVVEWAARHPVARADDGPSLHHAQKLLDGLDGAEAARDALARVSVPSR